MLGLVIRSPFCAFPFLPMSSDAVVPPPTHDQEIKFPYVSSVRADRCWTAESHLRLSLLLQHAQGQTKSPAGRQPPFSQLHQRRPGQPVRQCYVRESPPPLVNAKGENGGIVNYIVSNEDPHQKVMLKSQKTHSVPFGCKYRIRWFGFPPQQNTWVPRSSLLREAPDAVWAYKLI